jgi:hypothetical protein
MNNNTNFEISRREFLKFAGINLCAVLLPNNLYPDFNFLNDYPHLDINQLPSPIDKILALTPDAHIDARGFFNVPSNTDQTPVQVPLVPTQWNLENNTPIYRLKNGTPWGIVLHWFGDKEGKNLDLDGYLRGFNSIHKYDDYETFTSAHFLVGDADTSTLPSKDKIGIIQTQEPDYDGTPFVASHLAGISYLRFQEGKQYFVKAYNQLGYEEPAVYSLLQTLYDGRLRDVNEYTIGIEITGAYFDNPATFPGEQKIANVLAVVWALMKRYQIPASNILGHLEIQMNKSDPGKIFLTLIRYLVGIKALVEDDLTMRYSSACHTRYIGGKRLANSGLSTMLLNIQQTL